MEALAAALVGTSNPAFDEVHIRPLPGQAGPLTHDNILSSKYVQHHRQIELY
jgi:hypothetical protein